MEELMTAASIAHNWPWAPVTCTMPDSSYVVGKGKLGWIYNWHADDSCGSQLHLQLIPNQYTFKLAQTYTRTNACTIKLYTLTNVRTHAHHTKTLTETYTNKSLLYITSTNQNIVLVPWNSQDRIPASGSVYDIPQAPNLVCFLSLVVYISCNLVTDVI